MEKILRVALVVLLLGLGGCIIVAEDPGDPAYDFNGIWSVAMTGCQFNTGNAEIFQDGSSFTMVSGDLAWYGSCDPYQAVFTAEASGRGFSWTINGGAIGDDTLSGTYLYREVRAGECTGSFTATRIAYRGAGLPAGAALKRTPRAD